MKATRRATRWLTVGVLFWGMGTVAGERTGTVDRVWPVWPGNGAVVGPQPLFEIGYESLEDPHPRDLRFRIRLSPAGRGKSYGFDGRKNRGGWLVGEPGRVLYRPGRPLADGEYRWDVAAWNGVDWIPGQRRFGIRIDSIPPAAVEGLRVELDIERGRVVLVWEPVVLDREGRPEYVERYHVYRYERGTGFRRVRQHEIGVVEEPRFQDDTPPPSATDILFYRVTAEDEAGNEGDER